MLTPQLYTINNTLPNPGFSWRVGKVEPGLEKIPRLGVGLEKLLCEAYAKSIKRGHKKIDIWSKRPRLCICAASTEHKETSMNDESIVAENRANEITD